VTPDWRRRQTAIYRSMVMVHSSSCRCEPGLSRAGNIGIVDYDIVLCTISDDIK
jgi:hypothetical protein